ncbi:MAG: archease [Candidatus Micrarchaeia archaeon]
MAYRFVEHTSDIIIEATGKTFSEAFEWLAKGMFTQMGEAKTEKATEKFGIEADAGAMDILVVKALSELLAELEIREITPFKVAVEKFDKAKITLSFSVYGEKKAPKNIIKAVTFHELIVKEEKGKWTIRVLFDI